MDFTPEQIDALGKAVVNIVIAVGAIVTTVVSGVTAWWTYKTRRDTHFLGDKIREATGEPLQYRYDPERREQAKLEASAVSTKDDPMSKTGSTL